MQLAICRGGLDTPEATADWLVENEAYIVESEPLFFLNNENDKIASAAAVLKGKGISIRSIHAPFGSGCNLSNQDDEERGKAIQKTRDLLYKAVSADVEMIIIHPGIGGTADTKEQDRLNLLSYDSISQLMDAAEKTGVAMALENMLPDHPGCEIRHILETVDKINSPLLGICFDSGHAHVCGNMAESMEAFGERMINIHMQDNDATRDMHLQPPYGTTDWPAFVETLKKIDYNRPITIETRPWTGSSYKQMLKEVSAVLDSPHSTLFRCPKCLHALLKNEGQWFCGCAD